MNSPKIQQPWGTYRAPLSTLPYRLVVAMGLSRGSVARWIRHRWISHVEFVDAERNGIRFRLSVQNNATDGKLLTNSKTYDGPELDALDSRIPNAPSVFVDVGANTGYYSLSLAKRGFDRVLAIEPNPPTLELLRFNVRANAFSNVDIIPLCVGPAGSVELHSTGDLGSTSTIAIEGDTTSSISVESKPLLEILGAADVSSVTSMKIDVEGAECLALVPFFEAAPKTLWPISLVMEDCHKEDWNVDLIQFLTSKGYAVDSRTRGNVILKQVADRMSRAA